jgi:hypothetical protein
MLLLPCRSERTSPALYYPHLAHQVKNVVEAPAKSTFKTLMLEAVELETLPITPPLQAARYDEIKKLHPMVELLKTTKR